MSVATEYKNQYQWRDWRKVYSLMPEVRGKRILDLGCAIGDQSADLAALGAFVTGVDGNKEFIQHALSRKIPHAEFHAADLHNLGVLPLRSFDIIWSSFTVAYFVDLQEIIEYWSQFLKGDGLIVLTEMSGLLDFRPLPENIHQKIQDFYTDAFTHKRYDFLSASKIRYALNALGFEVLHEISLEDLELCPSRFDSPEIIEAWRNRFNRMGLLKKFIGQETIDHILVSMNHHQLKTDCEVKCFVAKKHPK